MDGTELTILVVVLLIDVIRCLRISLLQNDGWIYEACCTLANPQGRSPGSAGVAVDV